MAYELYICLKKETYESNVPPELESQLGSGTWKEAAFNGKIGSPRWSDDGNYVIVKGAFSSLTGELSAIKSLGSGMDYPNNSVLTKAEAQSLVKESYFTDV